MMQLHYAPSTAAMVPHILLRELGLPHELVRVDTSRQEHKRAEYLRLNPNGLLPLLVDGELALYETGAIVLHLCDCQPQAGLAPAPGTPQRAEFYKWLFWLGNTLHPALTAWFYPQRWVRDGNAQGAAEVRERVQARVISLLDQVETQLTGAGGPWFLGGRFSALDPYVFTLCRWTRNFEQGKARERAGLAPYLQRVLERPAVQQVMEIEGIQAPYY